MPQLPYPESIPISSGWRRTEGAGRRIGQRNRFRTAQRRHQFLLQYFQITLIDLILHTVLLLFPYTTLRSTAAVLIQFSIAHCPSIDAGLNVNIHNDAGCVREGSVIEYCRSGHPGGEAAGRRYIPFPVFSGWHPRMTKYDLLKNHSSTRDGWHISSGSPSSPCLCPQALCRTPLPPHCADEAESVENLKCAVRIYVRALLGLDRWLGEQ